MKTTIMQLINTRDENIAKTRARTENLKQAPRNKDNQARLDEQLTSNIKRLEATYKRRIDSAKAHYHSTQEKSIFDEVLNECEPSPLIAL